MHVRKSALFRAIQRGWPLVDDRAHFDLRSPLCQKLLLLEEHQLLPLHLRTSSSVDQSTALIAMSNGLDCAVFATSGLRLTDGFVGQMGGRAILGGRVLLLRCTGGRVLLRWVGGMGLGLKLRSNGNRYEISFGKNESVAGGTPGGVEVHVHRR